MFRFMRQPRKVRLVLDAFINDEALSINNARMEALAKLPYSFEKSQVLEIGSGPGLLTDFFIRRDSLVTVTDGRDENIEIAKTIFNSSNQLNVQNLEKLNLEILSDVDKMFAEKTFNVVFAFGILYHLAEPLQLVSKLSTYCQEIFLLEVIISSFNESGFSIEERNDSNQAVSRIGSRLSACEYITSLFSHFENVYFPEQPIHAEYQKFISGQFPSRIFLVGSRTSVPALEEYRIVKKRDEFHLRSVDLVIKRR